MPLPASRLGGRVFTDIHGTVERTKRLMGPLVEERLEQERLHGRDWPDKPVTILSFSLWPFSVRSLRLLQNDLLSWLLDGHPRPEERTVHDLAVRTLLVTFASIHTTSQVLYLILHLDTYMLIELL